MSLRTRVVLPFILLSSVAMMSCNLLTGPSAGAAANTQATFGAVVGPGDMTANPAVTVPPTQTIILTTIAPTVAPTDVQAATVAPTATEPLPILNKQLMGIQ